MDDPVLGAGFDTRPGDRHLFNHEAYAHSKPQAPVSEWHRLEDHLRGVATCAEQFAAGFGGSAAAWVAGLWHDLGKYAPDFQEYLRDNSEASSADDPPSGSRRVDHSSAGAVLAMRAFGERGLPVAFAIACHHSGLRNLQDLKQRMHAGEPRLLAARASGLAEDVIAAGGGGCTALTLPDRFTLRTTAEAGKQQRRSLETFTRMLFSALVDADFLDTEAFLDPERSSHRRRSSTLEPLAIQLDVYLQALAQSAPRSSINETRQAILADCKQAADMEPGFFSLTVPTGGGKTYASLAFALRHALYHGFDRVVVVAPYTSIIDQTATAYRTALAPYMDDVLEHHAGIDPDRLTVANALATENWDAPVVVTTAVQFFESLFARRSSRCRKLHRIARSVVILDEAQTLPVRLLAPTLDMLRELTAHYGTSVVFSTATQPALSATLYPDHRFLGFQPLEAVREINTRIEERYCALRRVHVALPKDLYAPTVWENVAEAMSRERQALAIVGRRDDARRLADLIPESFHLTAAMCAAHRRDTLAHIRERLASDLPCRVIATQVVEAGVDIDFPIVFRALAGIDSLAQAAGRCNREGRLASGTLHVFVPPSPPVRDLRLPYETARAALESWKRLDLADSKLYADYFRRLYTDAICDASGIQAMRESLRFGDVDEAFEMTDQGSASVVVPYCRNDGDETVSLLLEELRRRGPTRQLDRRFQPYIVSIPLRAAQQLLSRGSIEEIQGRLVLTDPFRYDSRFGIELDRSLAIDPEALIA